MKTLWNPKVTLMTHTGRNGRAPWNLAQGIIKEVVDAKYPPTPLGHDHPPAQLWRSVEDRCAADQVRLQTLHIKEVVPAAHSRSTEFAYPRDVSQTHDRPGQPSELAQL